MEFLAVFLVTWLKCHNNDDDLLCPALFIGLLWERERENEQQNRIIIKIRN